ncbi:GNAT family N-acetyltransferase [Caenimonas terrae]|uniref:GNAT family N-acetyltransferase n=1 Tax=Caenimonas terrae TaxID=696074 RepID=A0ABW0NHM9_9BURK
MSAVQIAPLQASDLAELAAAIRTDAVYAHLGGKAPAMQRFASGLQRALAGPPEHRRTERWLNYLVRAADSGQVLGQLQATVHDGIAEVAFLFGADSWGRGHASHGLRWLQQEVVRSCGPVDFWATAVPANLRCQALLARAGYVAVAPADAPRLLSYDDGDLVFTHRPPAA